MERLRQTPEHRALLRAALRLPSPDAYFYHPHFPSSPSYPVGARAGGAHQSGDTGPAGKLGGRPKKPPQLLPARAHARPVRRVDHVDHPVHALLVHGPQRPQLVRPAQVVKGDLVAAPPYGLLHRAQRRHRHDHLVHLETVQQRGRAGVVQPEDEDADRLTGAIRLGHGRRAAARAHGLGGGRCRGVPGVATRRGDEGTCAATPRRASAKSRKFGRRSGLESGANRERARRALAVNDRGRCVEVDEDGSGGCEALGHRERVGLRCRSDDSDETRPPPADGCAAASAFAHYAPLELTSSRHVFTKRVSDAPLWIRCAHLVSHPRCASLEQHSLDPLAGSRWHAHACLYWASSATHATLLPIVHLSYLSCRPAPSSASSSWLRATLTRRCAAGAERGVAHQRLPAPAFRVARHTTARCAAAVGRRRCGAGAPDGLDARLGDGGVRARPGGHRIGLDPAQRDGALRREHERPEHARQRQRQDFHGQLHHAAGGRRQQQAVAHRPVGRRGPDQRQRPEHGVYERARQPGCGDVGRRSVVRRHVRAALGHVGPPHATTDVHPPQPHLQRQPRGGLRPGAEHGLLVALPGTAPRIRLAHV
eukprot:ctg_2276.g363